MTTNSSSLSKVAVREFGAVTLWIVSCFFIVFLCSSPTVRSYFPSLHPYSSLQLFLVSLVAVMGIWDVFGLAFDSPFNPMVSLALCVGGKIDIARAFVMAISQFLGHVAGIALLRWVIIHLFNVSDNGAFFPPQPHPDVSLPVAVSIETFITFILCITALNLDDLFTNRAIRLKKWSLMTILIVLILSVTAEWTGGCMNPAMSFALSLGEKTWSNHGIYWFGPTLGAFLAGSVYKLRIRRRKNNVIVKLQKKTVRKGKKQVKSE